MSSASHRKSGKNGEHSRAHKSKTLKVKPSNESVREPERRPRKRKVENEITVQPPTFKNDLKSEASSSSDNYDEEADCNDGTINLSDDSFENHSRKRRRRSSSECCAICLDSFNGKNEKYYIDCGHYFHSPCIKEWLGLQKTCPTCRASISDCVQD